MASPSLVVTLTWTTLGRTFAAMFETSVIPVFETC
jgi:hypothetical protein